ncbi:MAG TPA: gamma-glutamyltransferase [Abditibacteriaceae bacterium]|jgi:gamma-glutamyltranspeptidase/glutathione hydrolase
MKPLLLFLCLTVLEFSAMAASRDPVRAPHGMVASTNRIASQIGVDVLKRGGNAVDASIAVAFALAVVYPSAGNLGGGGFMLLRLHDGRTTALDYRETAPAKATRDVYLNAKGELIKGEGSSLIGYRAGGVPGTVRGMELALKKYGSGQLSWAQLIEPARRLAAGGFPVSHRLARSLHDKKAQLSPYADSRRIFLRDGKFWNEGDVLKQPDLAKTLWRLQKYGPSEFYEGQTARLIADDMARHNGLITLDDLRAYAPRERVPLRGTYRGHEIISMPSPSSGGLVLLQMLNILEGFDLKRNSWNSAAHYHLLTETMRRAFADRAAWMGDADFASVPVEGLLAKDYAAKRRALIDLQKASSSTTLRSGQPVGSESIETTHFTVVDAKGNAVSNTYTLNGTYGSGVTIKGTGILLNNEMDDFTTKINTPNLFGVIQSEGNAIAPHKRPLSSMTPTFVLRKDGRLWFALGSPGGPTIINTVLQVILNVVDYDMNLQQAIDAPRIHHQWLPDEIVEEPLGLSPDSKSILKSRGHQFNRTPRYMGDVQAIMIEEKSGMRLGASDGRQEGAAIGY